MDQTANNNNLPLRRRLVIRVGRYSLSFSTVGMTDGESRVMYEPYTVKSGISLAANLREAFKTARLTQQDYHRVTVFVDAPVLMVPTDIFREDDMTMLYDHAMHRSGNETVLHTVLPDLNAVAVFAVNKDLKLVVDDNFPNAIFVCAMSPVWRYLHQRSFIGTRGKLYGYFHDRRLDIFSFSQRRFKYCNSFDVAQAQDSLYYLLYVWKQLMLKPEHDEMHIVGDIPEQEWMLGELRRYLQRAYVINPAGDFNRAPATQIKGLPYDLMTFYVKGR